MYIMYVNMTLSTLDVPGVDEGLWSSEVLMLGASSLRVRGDISVWGEVGEGEEEEGPLLVQLAW